MSELSANPADARKYRAMAFLIDAKGDAALLKSEAAPKSNAPDGGWKSFLAVLRKYRNGEVVDAREAAKAKDVANCFAAPGMLDRDSFIQACTDAICPMCKYQNRNNVRCPTCNGSGKDVLAFQPCPSCKGKGVRKCTSCDGTGANAHSIEENLETIVRTELWVLDQMLPDAPAVEKSGGPGSWASAVSNPQLTPIPRMTLETIADFDPRKCIFRKGSWIAP
jgi:hypothetical protein